MRLWHYKLIPILPNQMLVGQWRELIAIKRQWEKGRLKHRLVSYVMDYDKSYFYKYFINIAYELEHRNINFNINFIKEMQDFCHTNIADIKYKYNNQDLIYPEHNNRYLKQCYYNLQEKYDRKIITEIEWDKIVDYCYSNDYIKEIIA